MIETESEIRKRVQERFDARQSFFIHLAVYTIIIGGMWGMHLLFATGAGDGDMWPVPTMLFWGSGLAAHAINTWYKVGRPARRVDAQLSERMIQEYGLNWPEEADPNAYKAAREQIENDSNKLRDYLSHLAIYLSINAGLWWVFGRGDSEFPLIVTAIWGMVVAWQTVEMFFKNRQNDAIDREVERELARLRAAGMVIEKPKRHTMRLSDDGELISDSDDEEWIEEKTKYGQHG